MKLNKALKALVISVPTALVIVISSAVIVSAFAD
ncbi:MAG: hypothetical protein RI926_1318, partial [Actinomycetota bacterium]